MPFFLLQLASIGITVGAYLWFPTNSQWFSLVFALGFSHYLLALLYSRRPMTALAGQPYSYLPVVLLLGVGWWLYDSEFPIEIYFALHHLFNEAYLKARLFPLRRDPRSGVSAGALLAVFHGSAYLLLIRSQSFSVWLNVVLVVALLVSFSLYLRRVADRGEHRGLVGYLNLAGFEWLNLALVPVSFFYQFDFLQVVFYHFVIWGMLPLAQQLKAGRFTSAATYVGLTAVTLVAFAAISPLGPLEVRVPFGTYTDQFIFWSYVHITLSFALSRAHPAWINHWFAPRPGRAVPA